MEIDEREYNTVVLAALLHDVGKMIHRRKRGYEGSHPLSSATFMDEHRDKLENPHLYDLNSIIFLARNHDRKKEPNLLESPWLVGKSDAEKNHLLRLLKIIEDADSYSCSERDEDDEDKRRRDKRVAPLDSIFSYVNLDASRIDKVDISQHLYSPFAPSNSFPEKLTVVTDDQIEGHVSAFIDEIPDFRQFRKFEQVIAAWINLLGKYTWSVPSDTRYLTSDVSLYDHLRASAAVAACLYRRHIADIIDGKEKLNRKQEFILMPQPAFSWIAPTYCVYAALKHRVGLAGGLGNRSRPPQWK